ncbi:formate dehydrogenase subunit alpha [Breoghania sp. L-A4]|uniref:formate dehydrogenase subunit alpha n=1 Tax=Breoghania sp. L-A4 TaxID=2304600 RepID=UPI000E35B1BB|nr:formate dehydrogenase subunit alpha [Breoghania sp. L-A4]AXS38957.1 formate dehydrogenase subunit alpha [Breoghania sp. L-A4]
MTTQGITFSLNGRDVVAEPGETIWQVAKREGVAIPHLCHKDSPGYRSDGNCRACMVEVEGERTLAASCIRTPSEGMVVKSEGERTEKARAMVFELLMADQPKRDESPDPDSDFWTWSDRVGVSASRYAPGQAKPRDISHPAMAVNLDACISCGLCERACREVQVNDVIGMSYRGGHTVPTFDLNDPMGLSTCVACGECVQACPTGALFEKTLMDAEAKKRTVWADYTVDSVCPYCGVGCQTKVSVKNAKIVQVDGRDGPANENRLCVKGRFGYDYVRHPHRLTEPLIRRDDAPKDAFAEMDPGNPYEVFRKATWEEALARAASGLKTLADEDGGKAIAGFGSAKGSNEEAYLFQKLIRQGFGTNNVDHCTRLCHASSVAALMEGVGSGAVSAPFTAAEDADCIIVIGARPEQNHPVAATYLKQAAKRGAELIVMDPRGQELMRHATHSLRFKPGTDVALLNAMLNVIVTEKLYDEQYIQAHADGFEALKEKIVEFSPEEMEPVCGISADEIRTVARKYATSPRSIIFWGMGVSQHVHGTDNARCLIALALTTGQVGRPGTGLHPLRGQNNVQGASDAGLIPMLYPDYRSVEDINIRGEFEDAWGRPLDAKRGLTVVEIIDAIHDGEIRGMYVMGENPAMSDPDQLHARSALAKLDHLVVQDIFLTETAWHADVILPSSAHAEKLGTFTNTNRQVQIGRPVLPLPGNARQDWELIVELANRVGLDWRYKKGVSDVYEEMRGHMASLDNIPWSRVESEGSVTYPADSEDKPGNEIIFTDTFPTADGRARIVPAAVTPPDELPDETYPLVLTTGRMLEHWHTGSMTRRSETLDALEPEPVAAMNPREIERQGLGVGDMITVSTRRGAISLTLRSDREVADGMIFIPFCFFEAPANRLTNPQLDPFGKIPEFKFCAARVDAMPAVAAE